MRRRSGLTSLFDALIFAECSNLDCHFFAGLHFVELAVANMEDPVGNVEHLEVVGRGNDGYPALGIEALQEVDDLLAGFEV